MGNKFIPAVAAALFINAAIVHAATVEGNVVGVLDGDTLVLLDKNLEQHRIRLANVDAPEISHGAGKPGQPFGQDSKRSLSDLAYRQHAVADCPDQDRYGRQICDVKVDGKSVNAEQVSRGLAWVYRQYSKDPSLIKREDIARSEGNGLWAEKDPTPPWKWRH